MPLYYFNVNVISRVIVDLDGTELENDEAARQYAVAVAREIMRNDRFRSLTWRVEVCNAEREECCKVLFAAASEELAYFPSALRDLVISRSGRMAELCDDIKDVRQNLLQLRATLARADRMPYLAAENGRQVDLGSSSRGGVGMQVMPTRIPHHFADHPPI